MGGNVIFADQATMQRWAEVSQREFQALQNAAKRSQRTLLDHYGATNPAEFFAVASETFFELPQQLQSHHPELFELLMKYYRLIRCVGGAQSASAVTYFVGRNKHTLTVLH